jgi:hypothetical protein
VFVNANPAAKHANQYGAFLFCGKPKPPDTFLFQYTSTSAAAFEFNKEPMKP